ncbi:MAG: InlB B-repeat-containing protein [Lachnospiraceae bacterium]|nr:InlB B-repeat-containing protein [Lachnospiraceae bacterium]
MFRRIVSILAAAAMMLSLAGTIPASAAEITGEELTGPFGEISESGPETGEEAPEILWDEDSDSAPADGISTDDTATDDTATDDIAADEIAEDDISEEKAPADGSPADIIMADEPERTGSGGSYNIWVADVQVTDENKDSIPCEQGSIVYRPDSKELYLNNAKIDASGCENGIRASISNLTIILNGQNHISMGKKADSTEPRSGIMHDFGNGKITLSGSGSLKITGEGSGLSGDVYCGIRVSSTADLDIRAELNIEGSGADRSFGIYTDKGINIGNDVSVTLNGSGDMYGLRSDRDLMISGGNVNVTMEGRESIDGVQAEKLTISGGILNMDLNSLRETISEEVNGIDAGTVLVQGADSGLKIRINKGADIRIVKTRELFRIQNGAVIELECEPASHSAGSDHFAELIKSEKVWISDSKAMMRIENADSAYGILCGQYIQENSDCEITVKCAKTERQYGSGIVIFPGSHEAADAQFSVTGTSELKIHSSDSPVLDETEEFDDHATITGRIVIPSNGGIGKKGFTGSFASNTKELYIRPGNMERYLVGTRLYGASVLENDADTEDASRIIMGGWRWIVTGVRSSYLTLFADQKNELPVTVFNPRGKNPGNVYAGSALQEKVDGMLTSFSGIEKDQIRPKTLKTDEYRGESPYCDGVRDEEVANALLWPLSTREALSLNRTIRNQSSPYWLCSPGYPWLQTDGNAPDDQRVACVEFMQSEHAVGLNYEGTYCFNADKYHKARPAFNLKKGGILMVTMVEIDDEAYFKPAIKDSDIQFKKTAGKYTEIKRTSGDTKITIPYTLSGAHASDVNKIIVMVADTGESGTIQPLYMRELETESGIQSEGTGSCMIPAGFDISRIGADCEIYALALVETENESLESDYASLWKAFSTGSVMIRNNPVVTFKGMGQHRDFEQEVMAGTPATKPEDPTANEPYYLFDGWYDNVDCIGSAFDFATLIEDDITLYAKWKRADIPVTFYMNDGTNAQYLRVTVPYDTKVRKPDDPAREGYLFAGWYKKSDCTEPYSFNDPVTAIYLDLFAKWLKICTITFDPNQGSGSMNAVTIREGQYYTAPSCTLTPPEGNRFKEWYYSYRDIGGETRIDTVKPGQRLSVPVSDDLVLHAQWEKDVEFTVTFDANGHGTAPASVRVDSGTAVARPADPYEANYTFKGWTQTKLQEDQYKPYYEYDFTAPVRKDMTLYAAWRYSGKFDLIVEGHFPGYSVELDKTAAAKDETVTVTVKKQSKYYDFDYVTVPDWNTNLNQRGSKTLHLSDLTSTDENTWKGTFTIPSQMTGTDPLEVRAYTKKTGTHTHDLELHPEVPATCTEAGTKGWCECSICGYRFEYYGTAGGQSNEDQGAYIDDEQDFDRWVIIPPSGHAAVHRESKAATCKSTGLRECWECTRCHRYFEDEDLKIETDPVIPVDPDAHSYINDQYPVNYDFSADYTALYARKACDNACGVSMWEKVDVEVSDYQAPDCENAGHVTVSPGHFTNPVFEETSYKPGAQTITLDALGHRKSSSYEWNFEGDHYECIAHAICSRCKNEVATETCTPATASRADNHTRYRASFTDTDSFSDQYLDVALLTFDLNGHGDAKDKPETQSIRYTGWYDEKGGFGAEPVDPDDAELIFTGWYTDRECDAGTLFDFEQMIADDMTLYAGWRDPAGYTVIFNMNGHGDQIGPYYMKEGDVLSAPETPAAEGYRFAGWCLDPGLTVLYSFGSKIGSDLTFYAKWFRESADTVHLTFDMGGYGTVVPEQIIQKGKKPVRPDDPIDAEKVFAGWYADSSFSAKFDFGKALRSDTMVYAKWTDPDPDGFFAYFDIKRSTLSYNSALRRYEHVFTAGKITPKIVVEDFGGRRLVEGVDYTIRFTNNKNVDKKGKPAVATIKGKGNYKGSRKLLFYILPKSLGNGLDDVPAEEITLCGITVKSGTKVAPVLYYNGYKLTSKDIKLKSGTGNLKITSADDVSNLNLTITGKGNFSGSIKEAKITRLTDKEMKAKTIRVSLAPKNLSFVYDGKEKKLDAAHLDVKANGTELTADDYEVIYLNNVNAGTAKVIVSGKLEKGYTGSVVKTFKITPSKSDAVITVTSEDESPLIPDLVRVTYKKGGVRPQLTVRAVIGDFTEELQEGRDYKVTLKDHKKVTTGSKKAKYTITFKGNYKGTPAKSGMYEIDPAKFDDTCVSVTAADMIYTKPGKYTAKLYVTRDGVLLDPKTDYTATYWAAGADITKRTRYQLTGDSVSVKVTIKGKGNYRNDEIIAENCYTIKKKIDGAIDLSKAKITKKGKIKKKIPGCSYTGSPVVPEYDVYVKVNGRWVTIDSEAAGLKAGEDYEILHMNNTERGKGTILIRALPGSTKAVKSKVATFKIGQRTLAGLMQIFRW